MAVDKDPASFRFSAIPHHLDVVAFPAQLVVPTGPLPLVSRCFFRLACELATSLTHWTQVPCSGAMRIYVRILAGHTFPLNGTRALAVKHIPLEAGNDDTVLTVKAMLQEAVDVTPNHQRLLYRGICLENVCTLSDCNVEVDSELQMEISFQMQIGVRTWDNQNLNMDVFAIDRVMVIKAMLVQQTPGKPADTALCFLSHARRFHFTGL